MDERMNKWKEGVRQPFWPGGGKKSLYKKTLFVSRQDPEPDSSIKQLCNSVRNSILQLVINSRSTKQLHVLLQLGIKIIQPCVTILQ